MNTYNRLLLTTTLSSLVMLSGAAIAVAETNSAGNEKGNDQLSPTDKTSITISAVSGNNWEFFKVDADASTGTNLSPRAERGLDPNKGGEHLKGANLTNGEKVIILTGQCDISGANQTTIMQIFNYDSTVSDTSLPYFQLKAEKKDANGKWPLTRSGTVICRVNDAPFNFELRTNNKRARLRITQSGASVYDAAWTLSPGERKGITRFRFGAYHRNGGSKVPANIRFRNTVSTSVIVPANTGI